MPASYHAASCSAAQVELHVMGSTDRISVASARMLTGAQNTPVFHVSKNKFAELQEKWKI